MKKIYIIRNRVNCRVYIGQTSLSLEQRFKQHQKESKKTDSRINRPLYHAMIKYGVENFYIELLEETEDVTTREIYWINFYQSYHHGYNATLGGDGTQRIDYQFVCDLFSKHKSISLVAKEVGCNVKTVQYILKSREIDTSISRNTAIQKSRCPVQMDGYRQFASMTEAAEFVQLEQNCSLKLQTIVDKISRNCRGLAKSAYGHSWKLVDKGL